MESGEMTDQPAATFDYVIVGAGASCMGLLWRLLAKYDNVLPFTIAVIERGSNERSSSNTMADSSTCHNPMRWFRASHPRKNHSTTTTTLLQGTLRHRVIDVPIGQGLGGTTNIHASLCLSPQGLDHDASCSWPRSWRTKLSLAVNDIQQALQQNQALYAYESNTNHSPSLSLLSQMLHISLTVQKHPDGGGFRRRNYYQALVEPLLHDDDDDTRIHWYMGWTAERLVWNKSTVVGVECSRQQNWQTLRANRQVILCAGALETPVLLQVSGIGRTQDLLNAGIHSQITDYPGAVGHKLRDHVMVSRSVLAKSTATSINGVLELYDTHIGSNQFQIAVMDPALYADVLPTVLSGFLRYDFGRQSLWDRWMTWGSACLAMVLKLCLDGLLYCTPRLFQTQLTISIFLMNPKSTGTVTITPKPGKLATCRSHVDVHVDLAYLDDERDVTALQQGWIASHALFADRFDVFPGLFLGRHLSRFAGFAKATCLPYYHWCGTCAMRKDDNTAETNDDWVVDEQLHVRQVPGLRIVDASIFPTTISAPTALTCAAVGSLLASMLIEEYDNKRS